MDERIQEPKFSHKPSIQEQIQVIQARSGRKIRKARHRNQKGEHAVWPEGRTVFCVEDRRRYVSFGCEPRCSQV